ncbi:MAG: SpoIIIAH-like family protein [Ruminococcaceae bacterium]|nr:SpoIIIAH-like family protein [Oscillospiraceae bacterium]
MEETVRDEMEAGLVEAKPEKGFGRKMKKLRDIAGKIGARNLVVVGSLVLIGAAVILNFVLFGGENPAVGEGDLLGSGLVGDALDAGESKADSYFATAQLSRRQARDEALAVLQTVVDSEGADALAKEQATSDISRITSEMQSEANIETLIKSKGFEDCVAVIAEGSASIIVRSDGLLPNELSQIKEIVYEQAGIDPVSIKIIEQKPA